MDYPADFCEDSNNALQEAAIKQAFNWLMPVLLLVW